MGEPSLTPQERSIDPACPQAGLWVVVCADPAGGAMPRLASVGRGLFRGQSPRANLDQVARQHLLPLLVEALAFGKPVTREVVQRGRAWTVHAEPVLGPSGAVEAARGHYVAVGESPDPAPALGAWSYDIAMLQPYWSPELFGVYGFPCPEGEGEEPLPAPDGFRVVEQGGWTRMRATLERMVTADPAELTTVVFRVPSQDTGRPQKLAMFSHTVRDEQGVAQTMSGITMLVDDFDMEDDPGFAEQEFLSGVLRLTSDTLCVVDLGHGRFYTPNHPWSRLGIDMPREARVADAVHPEDLAAFEALLQEVLAGDSTPTSTVVRFRAFGPQGWTRLQATVLRIHPGGANGHSLDHVLCRLAHAPD